jgi:hypothetical protein
MGATPRSAVVFALRLALSLGGVVAPAAAQNLLTNGSFETGTLAGWTSTGPIGTECAQRWAVADNGGTPPPGTYSPGGGTQCLSVGDPPDGAFAAYTSFDGGGPLHFRLSQSFVAPAGVLAATLRFQDALRWDYEMFVQPGGVKTFAVRLLDAADVALLTPYTFSTPDHGVGGYDWTARAFDVTAVLAAHPGETLRLQFDADVPEFFVGPSGIGVDAVALDVTAIPEPGTAGLAAVGLLTLAAAARRRATRPR